MSETEDWREAIEAESKTSSEEDVKEDARIVVCVWSALIINNNNGRGC